MGTTRRERSGVPGMTAKHVVVLVLALGALLPIASCGGDDEQDPPQPAAREPSDASGSTSSDDSSESRERRARRRGRGSDDERERRRSRNRGRSGRGRPAAATPRDDQPSGHERSSGDDQSSQQQSTSGPRAEGRLERYLLDRFGGGRGPKAAWYDNIEAVEVSGGKTTIRTDISGADAADVGYQICSSVIGSLPGITDVVRVTGPPGNRTLEECVP